MSQVTFIDTAAASIATPVAGKDSLYVNDLGNLAKKSSAGVSVVYATTGTAFTPTGTGIPHVVGGVMNAAASLILAADIGALDYLGIGATAVWPLDVTKAASAVSAVAYGARLQQTISAAANNDALTAQYINATFSDGAFTGVTHFLAKWAEAGVDRVTMTDDGAILVNTPAGFAGNLLETKLNGTSLFSVNQAGLVTMPGIGANDLKFSPRTNYYQYFTANGWMAYEIEANAFIAGMGLRPVTIPCVLFTQVDSITVTDGTTLTTILGTAPTRTGFTSAQQKTLPANFWTVGKTIRISMRGRTGALLAATEQWRITLGSTTLADSGAVVVAAALTNSGFHLHAEITCQAVGAAGKLFIQGGVEYDNAGTRQVIPLTTTAQVTFDTTAAGAFDILMRYGAANAANTTTSDVCVIEVKN